MSKTLLVKLFVVLAFASLFGWWLWGKALSPSASKSATSNSKRGERTQSTTRGPEKIRARKAFADQEFLPTHKQVGLLTPTLGDEPIALQTFCLAPNGDIWACVGGPYVFMTPEEEFIKIPQAVKPMLQVYSPEHQLKQQWEMPFTPTAINYDSAENVFYVGGDGKLARVNRRGKILASGISPNVKSMEKLRVEIRRQMENDQKTLVAMNRKQATKLQDRVKQLDAKRQTEPLTKVDQKRLDSYRKRLKELEQQRTTLSQSISDQKISQTIQDRLYVKSIAVGQDFLFVALLSDNNQTYEVYRCRKDFSEPIKILSNQRGCCGRFDIQADKNDFWVADNIFFRMVKYNAEGGRLDAFGHKSTTEQAGFGSCCNPMNLRVFGNGDLLTAESSIGHIKRYSAKGKLLAYIGQAKVANGCKNVALGFDAKRNIYYMLHQDEHAICILKPVADD